MDKRIVTSFASMHKKHDYSSDLETEILFGEKVKITNKKGEWFYCKNISDNYLGWVHKKHLGDYIKHSHIIKNKNTIVYEKPDIKSKYLLKLYLNSKILVKNILEDWAEIILDNNSKIGFLPTRHIKLKDNVNVKNWLDYAKDFIGTPYLLGGKTLQGIDCSGLVQLCLETNGIKFPRNTIDQVNYTSKQISDTKVIEKGSILFWKGHVAIALSKSKIIHSNAYHMEVKIEPLEDAIKRISLNSGKIIKIKKIIN